MSDNKPEVPAIEGWFETSGGEARLIGSRCKSCGTFTFPKETFFCKNPACRGEEFEEVPLSPTGTLWSYTNSCYKPPAPYVSGDPFEPYIVAAVELAEEKMVVLGQVVPGVKIGDLSVGMEMKLIVDRLSVDDEQVSTIWKWAPVGGARAGS